MPELGSLGSVRGVLRNERPYREYENYATHQAPSEFRGLQPRRAQKIAKFCSLRDDTAPHIAFSLGLQDFCTPRRP